MGRNALPTQGFSVGWWRRCTACSPPPNQWNVQAQPFFSVQKLASWKMSFSQELPSLIKDLGRANQRISCAKSSVTKPFVPFRFSPRLLLLGKRSSCGNQNSSWARQDLNTNGDGGANSLLKAQFDNTGETPQSAWTKPVHHDGHFSGTKGRAIELGDRVTACFESQVG